MKYIELFNELVAIKRTKSENLTTQLLGMVLPSSKIDDPKDVVKCLNGMRTRIEQEETKQIKSLLTAALDMMISDQIEDNVHRTRLVFAGAFEKYKYMFNGQNKELAYLSIIDDVIEKAKENKKKIEINLAIPVIVKNPSPAAAVIDKELGSSDRKLYMTGMQDHINSKTLFVKDENWNDTTIQIDAPGEKEFRDIYNNDVKSIDSIEIYPATEAKPARVRILTNKNGILMSLTEFNLTNLIVR